MAKPKFKPGDKLILVHGSGGRVLEVYHDDGKKITEKSWIESQQKYASAHYYRFLRKPKNGIKAEEVEEVLKARNERKLQDIERVKREAETDFDSILALMTAEIQDD